MKCVVITDYWKNSPGGGITTYTTNLVEEFKSRNLDVNVIYEKGVDPQNHHVQGNKLAFALKSSFLLSKIHPDVIYCQSTWYCLLAGYLYKKTHSVKLTYTFHTVPIEKLTYFEKLFFQHLLNNCDCVTFVSKNLKDNIEKVWDLNFKRAEITYGGVRSPCEISEAQIHEFREQFNIQDGAIILLAHGLTSVKVKAEGAKLLIQAVKKLKTKFPNIVLILTKEGIFSKELKDFARNEGVYENIIFTGDLSNPNIPLKICNLYTQAYLIDGDLSLAVLEAMAMGKPIVSTLAGGIPEAIDDGINGLLVQPDSDMIAQKIDYLLENEEFASKLGINAQKTATYKFTWKKSADVFLSI